MKFSKMDLVLVFFAALNGAIVVARIATGWRVMTWINVFATGFVAWTLLRTRKMRREYGL